MTPLRPAAAILLSCASAPALAQHTTDNAVTSAEDAFGTSVGKESIGVYDENNIRGFQPGAAGNFRMEGMYYDIQGGMGPRTIASEVIHVGPSTQGYPFPAPTGIVDLSLRKADSKVGVSPLLLVDSYGSIELEADAQMPIVGSKLGLAFGAGTARDRNSFGGEVNRTTLGLIPRWRPSDNVEVLGFYNRQWRRGELAQPIYIPTDAFLPPQVQRGHYPGPTFMRTDTLSEAFGLVGQAALGDWTLRGGLFRSRNAVSRDYTSLIYVDPAGGSDRQVVGLPASGAGSWSGELRLSRRFADGPRQHLLTVNLRGKAVDARYGGADTVDLGPAALDATIRADPPGFAYGALTDDRARQASLGLAYTLKWQHLGEVTAGALRTHYVKRVVTPGTPETETVANVTLPYAAATLRLAHGLALYGSWVRGLEDAGSAPSFASNANQVLPAIRTRQYDFGLRWSPTKATSLILGGFSIAKPYIDLDQAGRYGVLGSESHKGLEVSLTSALTAHLRLVAGGVYQRDRVTALPSIAQPVGPRPVNQPAARTRINLNWTLPFAPAWTLDAYLNHDSEMVGTVDNRVHIPGAVRVGGGMRYRFILAGKPFTARVEAYNLTSAFLWVPAGSGAYTYNNGRNVTAYLTADF